MYCVYGPAGAVASCVHTKRKIWEVGRKLPAVQRGRANGFIRFRIDRDSCRLWAVRAEGGEKRKGKRVRARGPTGHRLGGVVCSGVVCSGVVCKGVDVPIEENNKAELGKGWKGAAELRQMREAETYEKAVRNVL